MSGEEKATSSDWQSMRKAPRLCILCIASYIPKKPRKSYCSRACYHSRQSDKASSQIAEVDLSTSGTPRTGGSKRPLSLSPPLIASPISFADLVRKMAKLGCDFDQVVGDPDLDSLATLDKEVVVEKLEHCVILLHEQREMIRLLDTRLTKREGKIVQVKLALADKAVSMLLRDPPPIICVRCSPWPSSSACACVQSLSPFVITETRCE